MAANPPTLSGVIAASAGNHAQGLSYHGTRLGVPVTIVMPRTTPTVKVMQTEQVGGIACHTGRASCFYRQYQDGEWIQTAPMIKDPAEIYSDV